MLSGLHQNMVEVQDITVAFASILRMTNYSALSFFASMMELKKSPGFRSFESALAFAKSEDFYGDNDENAN